MGLTMNSQTAPAHGDGPPGLPTYQIFVSSPGDVRIERVLASQVIESLKDEWGGRVHLDPFFWESQPLGAQAGFQRQIPPTSDFDLVVVILWKRLGTPLPPEDGDPEDVVRKTGTQDELEEALDARRENGKPGVLLYRKIQQPKFESNDPDELDQQVAAFRGLKVYLKDLLGGEGEAFKRAFHEFERSEEFARKLHQHLTALLQESFQTDAERKRVWQGSPYRGLQPFDAKHARVFRGRTADSLAVVQRLEQRAAAGRTFLLVYGASGVGKSSLVKAGVRQLLTRPELMPDQVSEWRVAEMRPSDAANDLIRAIVRSLRASEALGEHLGAGITEDELVGRLRENPPSIEAEVRAALDRLDSERASEDSGGTSQEPRTHLLMIIDQLEEVLVGEAEPQVHALARALQSLVEHESCRVWVIATVRSDLKHRFEPHPILGELIAGDGSIELRPPTSAQLQEIIEAPALSAGAHFEVRDGQSLAARIQDDADQLDRLLPLLQFALQQLWERDIDSNPQGPRQLTWDSYESLGQGGPAEAGSTPLERALTDHADQCLKDLANSDPAAEAAFEVVLFHLLRVDQRLTLRATLTHETLAALGPEAGRLVASMLDARLLTPMEGGVQLAHEALATRWSRLRKYAADHRKLLSIHARIQRRERDWVASHSEVESRDGGLLLGSELQIAEGRALLEHHPALDQNVQDYVRQSLKVWDARAADEERARRARYLQKLAALSLAVAGSVALVWLWLSTLDSERSRLAAEVRGTIATALSAESALERRHHLAQLQPDVRGGGLASAQQLSLSEPLPVFELRHTGGEARSLAFSPSRSRLAVLWSDGLVAAMRIDSSGMPTGDVAWRRLSEPSPRGSLRWSADGADLVVYERDSRRGTLKCFGSGDDSIELGPEVPFTVPFSSTVGEPSAASTAVARDPEAEAWSLDGKWQIRFDLETSLRIEGDAPWPGLNQEFAGLRSSQLHREAHPDFELPIDWIGLSPDGSHAAVAAGDRWMAWGSVAVPGAWTEVPLPSHGLPNSADGSEPTVTRVVWGSDGNVAGVALEDNSPRVLERQTDEAIQWAELEPSLKGPLADLTSLASVQSGSRWLSGDQAGWIRLWDPNAGIELNGFRGHEGRVRDVCMQTEGSWFASCGADGALRVWTGLGATNPVLFEALPPNSSGRSIPTDLEFSACGRWLARASADAVGNCLWRVRSEKDSTRIERASGFAASALYELQFSADGEWLAGRTSRSKGVNSERLSAWKLNSERGEADSLSMASLPEGYLSSFAFDALGGGLLAVIDHRLFRCGLAELKRGEPSPWDEVSAEQQVTWVSGPFLGAAGRAAVAADAAGGLWLWKAGTGWSSLGQAPAPWDERGVHWCLHSSGYAAVGFLTRRAPILLDWSSGEPRWSELGSGVPAWSGEIDSGASRPKVLCQESGDLVMLLADGSVRAWHLDEGDSQALPLGVQPTGVSRLSAQSASWLGYSEDGSAGLWDPSDPGEWVQFAPLGDRTSGVRAAFHSEHGWLARCSREVFLRVDGFDAEWKYESIQESVSDSRRRFYQGDD